MSGPYRIPATPRRAIELGDVARDSITGFEGVVIARTQWLNGCDRLTLQPRGLHEGKPVEAQTFDVQQLILVEDAAVPETTKTGGPRPEPRR